MNAYSRAVTDQSAFQGPITVATPDARIMVAGSAPAIYDHYAAHAELVDEIDLKTDGRYVFVAECPAARDWPSIVVALRYERSAGGFDPGVAATKSCLFIGAGNAISCYRRGPDPQKLWTDWVEFGFFGWAIHSDVVVMSAELELAAWDSEGHELWTTFVEPPWSYRVEGNQVTLDVMGSISSFDLVAGPTRQ